MMNDNHEMLLQKIALGEDSFWSAWLTSFDAQPFPKTSFADLDEKLMRPFIMDPLSDSATSDGALDEKNARKLLHHARVLTTDEDEQERVTVAGLLLCTKNPQRWMPSAYIEAVYYRGPEQDSNHQLDAKQITGPLDRQVLEAVKFVRTNMKIGAVKNPARMEIPQYSMRAVFEALVNAVAHRDYSISASKIRLFMFGDRLELYVPGSLANSQTVQSLIFRQATRNEVVTSLLRRCPVTEATEAKRTYFMEARGDGVTIILRECLDLAQRPAEYWLIDDVELRLTLPAADPGIYRQ